jgi:hypothetical protein
MFGIQQIVFSAVVGTLVSLVVLSVDARYLRHRAFALSLLVGLLSVYAGLRGGRDATDFARSRALLAPNTRLL